MAIRQPIAIIGASELQNPLIIKAKEMGFETHAFAWKDGSIGERTCDHFHPISIIEKDAILEACRSIEPVGVVSIASDLAVNAVTHVAKALGLVSNSIECTEAATNKYTMRSRFKAKGIWTPGFVEISSVADCNALVMEFPLIVKPTDRSGSRGVTKVFDLAGLKEAAARCLEVSFEKKAIVEEFIDGREYSVESISYKGRHTLLAITKKFTTGAPHFIETGHMEPSGFGEASLAKIYDFIPRALDALDIEYGASHAEIMIGEDGEIRIIEIGARMGGDCIGSDLVRLSTGYDFLKMVIDVACGREPDYIQAPKRNYALVRYIFTAKDLECLEKVRTQRPDLIYRASDIGEIDNRDVLDSSTRHGCYIIAGDDAEELSLFPGLAG